MIRELRRRVDLWARPGWRLRLWIAATPATRRRAARLIHGMPTESVLWLAGAWDSPEHWPSGTLARRELARRWAPWGVRP